MTTIYIIILGALYIVTLMLAYEIGRMSTLRTMLKIMDKLVQPIDVLVKPKTEKPKKK